MQLINAPYPRFRYKHLIFNSHGQRHCTDEDVEMLKNVDPTFAVFKDKEGKMINVAKVPNKPATKKKQTKKEK